MGGEGREEGTRGGGRQREREKVNVGERSESGELREEWGGVEIGIRGEAVV